jgi:iron complex transport system ATP-binding protein
MTVREVLRVGRYRLHQQLRSPPEGEEETIEQVLSEVGIQHLVNRQVETLSGGEWQRALIARALVQETPAILLDEPVASLDLRYQEEIYCLLRRIADAGRLVLVADHHIELASAHAERLLVLGRGTLVADATPRRVLSSELLQRVFGVRVEVFDDPVTGTPRLSRPK